jgi:hypothetical protein
MLGHGVGWWPAVAAGCHGVEAHRAAWPGRRGGPQCTRAARARGRWGAVTAAEAGMVARAATAHRRLPCCGVEGKSTRAVGGVRRAR